MRTRFFTMLLAVLAAMSSVASAAPDKSKTDNKQTTDDFHVTVSAGRGRLGLNVIEISPDLRTYFGAPTDRGVLVDTVRPDSAAARAGIRVGDIVLEVDGDAARSAMDMIDAMSDRKKGEQVKLAVIRDRKRIDITATLQDDPGPRWHSFGQDFDKALPNDFEWMLPKFRDDDVQKELEATRHRLEEFERRLKKLEHS